MKVFTKRNIMVALAICLIFAALMAVATIYDLQINHAVADLDKGYISSNLFGRFFETVGILPIYLLTAFSAMIIYHYLAKLGKKVIYIVIRVVMIIASVGLLFYMWNQIFEYLGDHYGFAHQLDGITYKLGFALLGLVSAGVIYYLVSKFKPATLNKLIAWAVIVVITAALSRGLSELLKFFAGRPRYRTMFVLNDFSIHRAWYEFQGKVTVTEDMFALGVASDAFKSFPSGHVNATAMLIALTALPSMFEKTNNLKCKILVIVATVALTVLVMFSRMVMGAHFLSDVVAGYFLTVVSYFVVTFLQIAQCY